MDIIRQVNPAAGRADLRFGTDAAGNVYFLNKQDGIVRRVVTNPAPPATAPVVLTLSTDATTISRRAGQVATVTLSRAEAGSAKLKVPYIVTGPLVGGTDYAALSGVLKIRAGQTRLPAGPTARSSSTWRPGTATAWAHSPGSRSVSPTEGKGSRAKRSAPLGAGTGGCSQRPPSAPPAPGGAEGGTGKALGFEVV